jgi:4-hydroxybutyrate dehydrogenase
LSNITYNFPRAIHFGWGEAENIAHLVEAHGKNVLIVTDKGIVNAGLLKPIKDALEAASYSVTVYDGVQPNPTYMNVDEATALYKENSCDMVIGLGGGSPIDAAKGVLVMANHPSDQHMYYGGAADQKPITADVPPLIAVPTTSGTGSEVSRGAIITDKTNRKRSLGSVHLLPKTVILDPKLTATMPKGLTAFTGLDALSHSVEAYAIDRYSPMCDAYAEKGVQLISESLVKAYNDGSQQQPRMDMSMASSFGAMAFMKGLGVVHSLAHQLSTQCDIPHGAACGIMMPHAVRYNLEEPATHPKYEHIAKTLSRDNTATAQDAPDVITNLLDSLKVPSKLGQWNVTDEDIEVMSENAMLDHCHPRNPVKCTRDTMRQLYKAAI